MANEMDSDLPDDVGDTSLLTEFQNVVESRWFYSAGLVFKAVSFSSQVFGVHEALVKHLKPKVLGQLKQAWLEAANVNDEDKVRELDETITYVEKTRWLWVILAAPQSIKRGRKR
jgi:hypothetical protein